MHRFHLLFAAIVVALFGAFPTGAAEYFRNVSAGSFCHAASGAAVGRFTRGLGYLLNSGSSTDYVVCEPVGEDSYARYFRANVSVQVQAGPTASTVTCVAQLIDSVVGAPILTSSKSVSLDAGEKDVIVWGGDEFMRTSPTQTLVFNCKVPPGARLGLIQWRQVILDGT